MNGTLNIFGSPRLTRPKFEAVNPALAEVTRLEMFGPLDIAGTSAVEASIATTSATGELTFFGASTPVAAAATSEASGAVELFVDEEHTIPGGSRIAPPQRPRIFGDVKARMSGARTAARGVVENGTRGNSAVIGRSGIFTATGFVFGGTARAEARNAATFSEGYATRGDSERLILAMLFNDE